MFYTPTFRDMLTAMDLDSIVELDSVPLELPNHGMIIAVTDSLFQSPLYPYPGIGYPGYYFPSPAQYSMNLGPRITQQPQNRQLPMQRLPPVINQTRPQCSNNHEGPVPVHYTPRNEARADFRGLNDQLSFAVSDNKIFKIELDVREYRPLDLKVKVNDGWLIVEGKHRPHTSDEDSTEDYHILNSYQIPGNVDRSRLSSVFTSEGMLRISAPFIPRKEEFAIVIEMDDG